MEVLMLESKFEESPSFWAFTIAFAIDSQCDIEAEAWHELSEACRDQSVRAEIVRQLKEMGYGKHLLETLEGRPLPPSDSLTVPRGGILQRLRLAR